jgi:hypothetical protein
MTLIHHTLLVSLWVDDCRRNSISPGTRKALSWVRVQNVHVKSRYISRKKPRIHFPGRDRCIGGHVIWISAQFYES